MIDIWIEITIVALTGWAVWKTLPKAPNLEWKYFHSLLLSTQIRGHLEKQDQTAEEWREQLRNLIPYHPEFSSSSCLFGNTEDSNPSGRWADFFQQDDVIEEYLMRDPAELGPSYQPSALLRWLDISEGGQPIEEHLRRKLARVIVVGQGEFAMSLSEELGVPIFSEDLDIDALSRGIPLQLDTGADRPFLSPFGQNHPGLGTKRQ